jgi:PAS domain S-box-containing protein
MSEFSALLEKHTAGKAGVKTLAAAMGVDPSMISLFTSGTKISCRPDTLMKMVTGVSKDPAIQAQLLQAYFRDQVIDLFKPWIRVEPQSARQADRATEEAAADYGNPLAAHSSALKALRLPNDILRALTDIARAIPGRQKFRIVIEDLGEFAREDLLAEPPPGYSRKTPLVVTDIAGRVTSINSAFTRMCGYSEKDLLGKKPGAVLQGPATEPGIVAEFHDAIARRIPFDCTITNYHASGRTYRVHIQMTPLFDRAGQHTGFRAIERRLPARK